MQNKHVEYKKIVEGADKAVLFIHGIMGTPNHFRDLIPLVPENYSVYAMVTYGHCGSVTDFSNASLENGSKVFKNQLMNCLKHIRKYTLWVTQWALFFRLNRR